MSLENKLFRRHYDPYESVFIGYSNQQVCHGVACVGRRGFIHCICGAATGELALRIDVQTKTTPGGWETL